MRLLRALLAIAFLASPAWAGDTINSNPGSGGHNGINNARQFIVPPNNADGDAGFYIGNPAGREGTDAGEHSMGMQGTCIEWYGYDRGICEGLDWFNNSGTDTTIETGANGGIVIDSDDQIDISADLAVTFKMYGGDFNVKACLSCTTIDWYAKNFRYYYFWEAKDTEGPFLRLENEGDGNPTGDDIGTIDFLANDTAGPAQGYAEIQATVLDYTDGSEDAVLKIGAIRAGTSVDYMVVGDGNGVGFQPGGTGDAITAYPNPTNNEANIVATDDADQILIFGTDNDTGEAYIYYDSPDEDLRISNGNAASIDFDTDDTFRGEVADTGTLVWGAPTGGECGAGCVNAQDIRVNDAFVEYNGYQHMALMAGAGTVPAGGGIAGCTPVSAFDSGSNDIFLRQCSFSASADNAIYWTVPFPESAHLATDLDVSVRWTSATTTDGSDDVIWNATAVCFSNDDAINGNAFPAVDAVTDTQTAAGDILRTSGVSLTPAGSPTDFDTCVIRVSRDADNGSDNFNGTAELISVDLYWVNDLPNED